MVATQLSTFAATHKNVCEEKGRISGGRNYTSIFFLIKKNELMFLAEASHQVTREDNVGNLMQTAPKGERGLF